MSNKLESKIRQILRDIRFPTQDIRYEFCDALTFASDEADFFMRANQFLYTLQNYDLNYEFYDKAKACFGAEIIDLYFDSSFIEDEWLDDSLSEFHKSSTVSQINTPKTTIVSKQLDLFAHLPQMDLDKIDTGIVNNHPVVESSSDNDQLIIDTPDMIFDEIGNVKDRAPQIAEGQYADSIFNDRAEETENFRVITDGNLPQETDSHEKDSTKQDLQDIFSNESLKDDDDIECYEEIKDKNWQNDLSDLDSEVKYSNAFERVYDHDDYAENDSDYAHENYEFVDHNHQTTGYYNDDSNNFYEDEFDLEETSLNIYDIEELESANADSDDFEIPDIGYEDILGATLNKVAVQDRITQEVIKFIEKNDLDYTEYNSVLESIFFHLGWNGAKNAVQRLFTHNADLPVAMLTAIFELKLAWEEHDAFWAIRHKNGSFENTYAVLSWPIAYAIIDSYSYIPDTEEIIDLLYQKFYQWYDSPILPRAFPCFMKYIWSQFFGIKGLLPQTYHEDFMFNEFTPELWADSHDLLDSQLRKALVEHGIAVNDPFPSLENWTLEKARERLRALNETQNSINTEDDDE